MGTDIHMLVQTSRRQAGWRTRADCEGYSDRCYTVFAALADVRNGYGSAGSDRCDPIMPIHPQRGLPDDGSLDGGEDLGDHSYTYLGLDEILAYDWDHEIEFRGLVSEGDWAKHLSDPRFLSCTGADGWSVVLVGREEMERRQRNQDWIPTQAQAARMAGASRAIVVNGFLKSEAECLDVRPSYYVKHAYRESLRSAAGNGWWSFVSTLIRLAEFDGLRRDQLRIVFGFDN